MFDIDVPRPFHLSNGPEQVHTDTKIAFGAAAVDTFS